MSNKYFIWKDEKCKGINPEWLEISGKEFYRLVSKPENAHRKFIKEPIDPENISMGFFVLEVTKDNYNKFDALRKRNERSEDVLNANRKRHKLSELTEEDELSKNVIPFVISFDAPVADEEELHYHDIVSDNGDSEDFIVDKIQLSNIYICKQGHIRNLNGVYSMNCIFLIRITRVKENLLENITFHLLHILEKKKNY